MLKMEKIHNSTIKAKAYYFIEINIIILSNAYCSSSDVIGQIMVT